MVADGEWLNAIELDVETKPRAICLHLLLAATAVVDDGS